MGSEQPLVKLFLDEARVVAGLSHRSIVQIFDLGEDADGFSVAMEHVPGPSVAVLLERLATSGARLPPALSDASELSAEQARAIRPTA